MNAPGSPSSPLQTTYLTFSFCPATCDHFLPVGNPAPPRPRSPESNTLFITASGVISNTASLYSVFDVLEAYGIRDYFEDVTLSSVTGYRKPHPGIFQIALREMKAKAEECAYVGDTLSRDVIGAKRMHFGAAIQIRSFLSSQKDEGVDSVWQPDHVVEKIADIVPYLEKLNGRA